MTYILIEKIKVEQALEALEQDVRMVGDWTSLGEYKAITLLRHALNSAQVSDTEKQDKFCDDNCVWTDHHKDCVRSDIKKS